MLRIGTLTWLADARTVERDALVLELVGEPCEPVVIPLPATVGYVTEQVVGFAQRHDCSVLEVDPVCG